MARGRQFVKYDLFAVDPLWRRLSDDEKNEGRREFSAVIDELSSDMFIRSFSMVGLRGDADFMLWHATETLEQLQEMATLLWSTSLGKYLTQPYSYLALTRKSQYVGKHQHTDQEGTSESLMPGNAKYFVFVDYEVDILHSLNHADRLAINQPIDQTALNFKMPRNIF